MTVAIDGSSVRRGRHARRPGRRASSFLLHLRARSAPWLVVGLTVTAIAAWAAADWLVSREWAGGPEARAMITIWAPVLVAVLVSSGLAGADEELERSTAVPWRWFRMVHVVVAVLLGGAALTLTGLWEPQTYGAFELVRNTVACVGMVAASAVVLGARLAWAPVCVYVAVVYLAAPGPHRPDTAWWTWPIQPWSASLAAGAAVALFVSGVALYGWFGARPSRDQEAS